jgi:hypothetical protein
VIDWLHRAFFPPADHPISDSRAGPGAYAWKHVRVCPHCLEITGHQEFMTRICLSCGKRMDWFPRPAAIRRVRHGGRWRYQLRDGDADYLRVANMWVRE